MGRAKIYERASPELFRGDTELKNGAMNGTYTLQGTGYVASYSLKRTVPKKGVPPYPIRGTVSLRDPMTGSVMKASGAAMRKTTEAIRQLEEERKSKNQPPRRARTDDYTLTKRAYSRTDEPGTLRDIIAVKCWELYQENEAQLTHSPKEGLRTGAINFSRLEASYLEEYLRTKKQAARKRKMLDDVGLALETEPVGKISRKKLDEVRERLGSAWRLKFREAGAFLDFVYDARHDSENQNAFRDYLERNPEGIDYGKLQRDATEKPSLTPAESAKLIKMALEHPENSIIVAAATIMQTGLDAARVCEMSFGDFLYMEDFPGIVFVKLYKENNAGAVHNYTFPTRPIFCKIVDTRRSWLEQQGLQITPGTRFICNVDKQDDIRSAIAIKPSKVTDGVRNLLSNIGIKKFIFDCANKANESDKSGAGVKLLKGTYVKILETCGLDNDIALLKFLKHEPLTNLVQANYYRSFIDATANYSTVTALKREQPTGKKTSMEPKVRQAKRKVSISPAASDETLIANMHIKLKAGEKLVISAPHGCKFRVIPVGVAPISEPITEAVPSTKKESPQKAEQGGAPPKWQVKGQATGKAKEKIKEKSRGKESDKANTAQICHIRTNECI